MGLLAKKLLKVNILALSCKKGFTLIEIIVALLILGIMLTVGLPRLNRAGATIIDDFLVKLNTLVQEGAQRATTESVVYKITFNFKAKPAVVELSAANKQVTAIIIPEVISVDELYINRKLERGREEAWFFITPDGISQEVIINIIDTQRQETELTNSSFSFVLNPFTVQFKLYDFFQRPAASA